MNKLGMAQENVPVWPWAETWLPTDAKRIRHPDLLNIYSSFQQLY